jgi:hypothetical protein
MIVNPVPIRVEFAFGFGPGSTPGPGDWIDVTSDVLTESSNEAVTAVTGRTGRGTGISPGTLTLTLENTDGRYNPRNTSGPYYGLLDIGTQVRIVSTVSSVDRVRWRGYVSSGWPQTITSRWPTVTIQAHDILGLLAQTETPETAFHAVVQDQDTAPSHWWVPGPSGWTDRVTGRISKNTSQLVEFTDVEVTNGAGTSWGAPDADGFGIVEHPSDKLTVTGSSLTVLARVKLPTTATRSALTGTVDTIVILSQHEMNEAAYPFILYVYGTELVCMACSSTFARSMTVLDDSVSLMDDNPHTVMVHVPADSGAIMVWIDGRRITNVNQVVVPFSNPTTIGPLYIGDGGPFVFAGRPFQGILDQIVTWSGLATDEAALTMLAAETHEAARHGWAGLFLHERIERLVNAMGLEADLGTLDESGILTLQSYRQGQALELLQNIENTEQGRIWVDRTGKLRFSRRTWAWDDTRSTTVQLTFSDDPALIAGGAQEMLEEGTVVTDDPLDIVNVAAVNSTFGRQQTVEDTASIAKFGRRGSIQLSNLLHPTDRQSRAIAEWLVRSQSEPKVRVERIRFRVEDNPDVLGPFAAEVEEGWLVRVRKPDADLDLYGHVIGIEHVWTWTGWTVTLTLDSTRTGWSFFRWGTSTWGGGDEWAF